MSGTRRGDTQAQLVAVDLFSGAGGFTRGLANAGIDVVLGVDSWDRAVQVYETNFDHPCLQADVSELSADRIWDEAGIGSVDLVVGGPPCQGFSIQRTGKDADSRNHLVLEFGRLAAELDPQVIIMENVLGLTGRRGKKLLNALLELLGNAGYAVEVRKVDAQDFGVPQRRKRVLVIARRPSLAPLTFRAKEGPRTVWEAIGDLREPPEDPTSDHGDPLHRRSRLSKRNVERLTHVPPGGGFEDIPMELRAPCHRKEANQIGHRQVYGRMHPDEPAPTITARFDSFTRGQFAHPYRDRNITLREGARLQGFPDEHSFAGTREEIAALIGNALPPPLGGAAGVAALRSCRASSNIRELQTA